MKIIKPSFEILTPIDRDSVFKHIELCGRVCYKSEGKITTGSAETLITRLMSQKIKHESVFEHYSVTVRFIHNRAFTHQLVRHRIASYSQESQRFCNYTKGKFNEEITFIEPLWYADGNRPERITWETISMAVEKAYFEQIANGLKPEQARGVLTNDAKTEIVMTTNLRDWRHIFSLRCDKHADPEMRRLMQPLEKLFQLAFPEIFGEPTLPEAVQVPMGIKEKAKPRYPESEKIEMVPYKGSEAVMDTPENHSTICCKCGNKFDRKWEPASKLICENKYCKEELVVMENYHTCSHTPTSEVDENGQTAVSKILGKGFDHKEKPTIKRIP